MSPNTGEPPRGDHEGAGPDEAYGRAAALAELAAAVAPMLPAVEHRDQLRSICATARLVLGAAAVSIAVVVDDATDDAGLLRYTAADGEGASEIVGTSLAPTEGLAGFVVTTGQSLVVDGVGSDPRFARDIAESTGYVPTSMLVVPVTDRRGRVLGVLSVLDRDREGRHGSGDALEIAGSFAAQAMVVITHMNAFVDIGSMLLRTLAQALGTAAPEFADELRQSLSRPTEPDAELAEISRLFLKLGDRPQPVRAAAVRILHELLAATEAGPGL